MTESVEVEVEVEVREAAVDLPGEGRFILQGVAGSQAQGLATPESDVDLHGVFGWRSEALYGLGEPRESKVGVGGGGEVGDHSYHEIRKFLGLALRGNPTVLELLWLEEYLVMEPEWGERLVEIRGSLLGGRAVRAAFRGYAAAQLKKAREGLVAATRAKNVRHLFRLLEEGRALLETGEMLVRVSDPGWYFDLAWMDQAEWEGLFVSRLEEFDRFSEGGGVLPEEPDREVAEAYLRKYRKAH